MTGATVPPSADVRAPSAWRPLSALCVVALVLALLGAIPALLGLWWTEAIPLVLAILGFASTAPHVRRGRGLAISAAVVAVVVGAGSFVLHRLGEMQLEEHVDGLVRALDRNDRVEAAGWVADPAQADASVARWAERMAAVHAALGRYKGALAIGNVFWGVAAAMVRPPDLEEIPPHGTGDLDPGEALWARATFDRGNVWFAIEGGEPNRRGAVLEAMKDGLQRKPPRWVRDVRLFQERR